MSANSLHSNSKLKTIFSFIYSLFVFFLMFSAASLFIFALMYFIQFGFSAKTFVSKGLSSISFTNFPAYLNIAYQDWIVAFQTNLLAEKFDLSLLLPILNLPLFLIMFYKFFLKEFIINRRKDYFASINDIQEMDVLGKGAMLFGRINGFSLKSKGSASSLVWFEKGLGKTTSIAIPNVLEAKNENVFAIDCSGTLAKFTSGYRAKISKVFNFNWDKLDNLQTGERYPRWNPLSHKDMPKKGVVRNNYVKFMAQYLAIRDSNNYWEKLASLTLEGLLHFFISKTEQAIANDYFLTQLSDGKKLTSEDRDVLLSYYSFLPENMTEDILIHLEQGSVNLDNYLPIGSWYNIPSAWQGKELCFSMLSDTLLSRYFLSKDSEENDNTGTLKNLLEEFLGESIFFGYDPKFLTVFNYLNHLSKKQRRAVLSIVLDSLSIFRKASIRERTSLSDIHANDLRGIVDLETGKRNLVTIYSEASTKESSFMSGFFLDILLVANINSKNTSSPVFFVMDDFELLPRLRMLEEFLSVKEESNISSMFITNEIENINTTYGKNVLEEMINKTKYKLMSAENNDALIAQLGQLSIYDSKANQVNMKSGINYVKNPQMAFKSKAYHNLSKDLASSRLKNYFSRGKYLLLVQDFYDFPIKTDSLFFAKNQELKAKAAANEVNYVDKGILENRDLQDIEVPNLIDVIREVGVDIASEQELDDYLDKKKSIIIENISKVKESYHKTSDNSKKWSNSKKRKLEEMKLEKMEEEDNWWLGESAFSTTSTKTPFDDDNI